MENLLFQLCYLNVRWLVFGVINRASLISLDRTCDRDNCTRYENHFINATFGQNSISDAVCAPPYQLFSVAGCMSDSDSNNIVKKKGRPWRKTWELHWVKNRGRIGQECCGIWHLLSPLSWDDGSHLSSTCVYSLVLLSAPLHIYSDGTWGDAALSNAPCEGENRSLLTSYQARNGGMQLWPSIHPIMWSLLRLTCSLNLMLEYDGCIDLYRMCMWSVTQWRGWFWTADVVCVIVNPFQTTD